MQTKLVNENFKEEYVFNLLTARGIKDVRAYLVPTSSCRLDPFNLCNIDKGIELLRSTLDNKDSHILLVVDCDVDGFTSSAIMWQFIKQLNPEQKISYILHEHKQHGLEDHIESILNSNEHYDLVILPDSSSNDYMYHDMLGEINTKVLVLDHHDIEPGTPISDNAVIINNQLSPDYSNKDLTGAGVAWQFCMAISKGAYYLIDLAALGICGDMGSILNNENRYIMYDGFNHISNYFFQQAIEKQSYSMGDSVNPISVAFYIVPLMNALIRVGTQDEKDRLFQALIDGHKLVPCNKRGAAGTTVEVAIESLRECTNAKSKQTRITDQMVDAMDMCISKYNLLENKILFVRLEEDDDYPSEIVGLCAMKLAAKYKHPTILARLNEEGYDRGSIRNVADCALTDLKSFLNDSGYFEYVQGHANAAGASILDSNLRKFHEYANEALSNIDFNEGAYDVNFERNATDDDLYDLLSTLGSYTDIWGQANPEPMIAVSNIHVNSTDIRIMGKMNDTLKIEKNGIAYIKFKATDMIEELKNCKDITINVVGRANLNVWGGRTTPQLFIENYEVVDSLFDF